MPSTFRVIDTRSLPANQMSDAFSDAYRIYHTMFSTGSDRDTGFLSLEKFTGKYTLDSHDLYLAEYMGQRIGMAVVDLDDAQQPKAEEQYIDLFGVTVQGLGHGSVFLTLLEDYMQAKGVTQIELSPVNNASAKFYMRHGYKPTAAGEFYLVHHLLTLGY